MQPDSELALRVAAGDRAAFLALYDRYAGRVYGLCLRMLQEPAAAEEASQETFLKLWARAGQFDPRYGALVSWLLTIARRSALDRIRREARRPQRIGGGPLGEPAPGAARIARGAALRYRAGLLSRHVAPRHRRVPGHSPGDGQDPHPPGDEAPEEAVAAAGAATRLQIHFRGNGRLVWRGK